MDSASHLLEDDRRVVIHFDLDAFYVTCEREINPQLRAVPVAVSQYNPYGTLEEKASHEVHRRLVVCPDGCREDSTKSPDANGGLIAVSYEARAAGVKRNDRGLEAARKCPDLRIVHVPVKHGKADLTMYRSASKRVMDVLTKAIQNETRAFSADTNPVEIASIDEVYVDVTVSAHAMARRIMQQQETSGERGVSLEWGEYIGEASVCTTIAGVETLSDAAQATNALNKDELRRGSRLQVLDSSKEIADEGSHVWWHRNGSEWSDIEVRLACGAFLASRARAAVVSGFDGGVFTLSAGISSNKTLAKLASGLKKPNRQTLINRVDAYGSLETLFHPLPLGRIRGLGGKFGVQVADKLKVTTVGQLAQVPLTTLQITMQGDAKTARFLYDIARGICRAEVTARTKVKSIECSKTFRGPLAISSTDLAKLTKWIGHLCNQLKERLTTDHEENNRIANTLTVSVHHRGSTYHSKQCRAPRSLDGYKEVALQLALQLVDAAKVRAKNESVTILGLGVSGSSFEDLAGGSSSIMAAFQRGSKNESKENDGVSSQSSIRQQVYSATNRARSPVQSKSSAMDKWLSETVESHPQTKQRPVATTDKDLKGFVGVAKNHLSKSGKLGFFLGRNNDNGTTSSESRVKRVAPPVALPTMDEIDPAVLSQLPEDLRMTLIKEIASQKKSKSSANTNFFHVANSRKGF